MVTRSVASFCSRRGHFDLSPARRKTSRSTPMRPIRQDDEEADLAVPR